PSAALLHRDSVKFETRLLGELSSGHRLGRLVRLGDPLGHAPAAVILAAPVGPAGVGEQGLEPAVAAAVEEDAGRGSGLHRVIEPSVGDRRRYYPWATTA